MQLYIFHRKEGFYPLKLENDNEAIANAEYNLGTLKVEKLVKDQFTVVWRLQ